MSDDSYSSEVADALIMLAMEKHAAAGDFRRHIELAQIAKQELANGWDKLIVDDASRQAFLECMKPKGKRK